MGATFKKLFDNHIRVDIITTVEQQYEELKNSYFNDQDIELLKDTIILASICTPPSKILNKFNKEKLFLFETYQAFKENSKAYNGASVGGEVTLSLLLDMNIKNIYLLGIDLAIDEKKLVQAIMKGIKIRKKALDDISKVNTLFDDGVTTLKDEYLEVKGTTKDKVITTRVFALSIAKYTELIAQFKKEGQHLFNFSEESAYIQGVEYLSLKEFNNIQKNEISNEELLLQLNEISEYGLKEAEFKKLKNRIEEIENLTTFVDKTLSSSVSKKYL